MSIQDIIRAWKDANYRESLSEEQRALLPSNPIGEVLSQDDLCLITGGFYPPGCRTIPGDPDYCSCWDTYPDLSWCC
jgi:mersacidin/lichenicidin family type 2 lantibiotic